MRRNNWKKYIIILIAFIVGLVANLAAVPMQESGIPLLAGAVPILVVLAMELLLSVLSYHSIKFRRLVCGNTRRTVLGLDDHVVNEDLGHLPAVGHVVQDLSLIHI